MRKGGLWGPRSGHCRGEERQCLRQTFVGGPDPGTGRGCWRHAASWAGTCFLCFPKAVSGAGHPWAPHHLSAKRTRAKQRGFEWPERAFQCSFHIYIYIYIYIYIKAYSSFSVVLVSTVQQSESATHIHVSPLFRISFPFRSPQGTE